MENPGNHARFSVGEGGQTSMVHCKEGKGHHTEGQGHFPHPQEEFKQIRIKMWKL